MKSSISDILESATNIFAGRCRVRSYSGKGMNGKLCLGIIGRPKELKKALADVFKTATRNPHVVDPADVIDTFMNYSEDDMGLDKVYYWPKIPFSLNQQMSVDGDEEDEM